MDQHPTNAELRQAIALGVSAPNKENDYAQKIRQL
jgi:hypothetical protein